MDTDFDVVIIGSGVAGALLAWKLSTLRPGSKILILEAGRNTTAADQHGYEYEFRKTFHRVADRAPNAANTFSRDNMFAPYKEMKGHELYPQEPERTRSPFNPTNDPEPYYDRQGPDAFQAPYLRQVGGSTWAWKGNTPRFLPNDFLLRSKYGVGVDWPRGARYDDLEPYYAEAERELGVAGERQEWSDPNISVFGLSLEDHFGKRGGFPLPAIEFSHSEQMLTRRLSGKSLTVNGYRVPVHVMHTPQARTSRAYRPHDDFAERPACEGNSNCVPLCPIGAKYDATVHLKQAVERGGVELRQGAVVVKLECDSTSPNHVARILYRDWASADPQELHPVSARFVAVAAHAIETPKLLLLSNLANSSGQVGHNLMDHLSEDVTLLSPEPLYPFRGPQGLASIEILRDGPFRSDRSAVRITIGNDGVRGGDWSIPGALRSNLGKNTFGKELQLAVAQTVTRGVRFGVSVESLPYEENRVSLSDKLDKLGIPRPQIHYRIDDYSLRGLDQGYLWVSEIARTINSDPDAMQPKDGLHKPGSAAHIMGTCRMGDDPKSSVVDINGKTHDLENLYIVGSSVFPTSGTGNPTLTLAALTLKTADAMARAL